MPKAFDRHDDSIPTVKWVGEVEEVNDGYFSGVIHDEYVGGEVKTVVEIPLSNIVETERQRAVPGMLFYCDVEVLDDGAIKNIRGIEFDDELTASSHKAAAELLLGVIAKDEERWSI